MSTFDIELGQGDSDLVGVVLKENGVAVDNTGATILFNMKNNAGLEYNIECQAGATINGEEVPISAGGVTVPFTDTHSVISGLFLGKFTVTLLGSQKTFPSGNDYVSVRIWEAI